MQYPSGRCGILPPDGTRPRTGRSSVRPCEGWRSRWHSRSFRGLSDYSRYSDSTCRCRRGSRPRHNRSYACVHPNPRDTDDHMPRSSRNRPQYSCTSPSSRYLRICRQSRIPRSSVRPLQYLRRPRCSRRATCLRSVPRSCRSTKDRRRCFGTTRRYRSPRHGTAGCTGRNSTGSRQGTRSRNCRSYHRRTGCMCRYHRTGSLPDHRPTHARIPPSNSPRCRNPICIPRRTRRSYGDRSGHWS